MDYLDFFNKRVRKFDTGGKYKRPQQTITLDNMTAQQRSEYDYIMQGEGMTSEAALAQINRDAGLDVVNFESNAAFNDSIQSGSSVEMAGSIADNQEMSATYNKANNVTTDSTGRTYGQIKTAAGMDSKVGKLANFSNFVSQLNNTSGSDANTALSGIKSAIKAKNPMAGIGAVFNAGVDYADKALMGDKNFDTESQATDELVNGTTNALMSTGNPAAIGVAMAIKGLNFIDKSTGKTVPGFEVNIPNSGFGGVKESKSDQSFRLTQTGKMDKKLSMRNLQAEQALAASGLSDDIKFEQEARMNSVQNTLINNQIALSGGLSTDLLAAKRGAKLQQLKDYKKIRAERWAKKVVKAQDGAKLKNVEVSSEPNVIPEGDYHKNKHDLDLDNITKKGIPVIQVPDDSVETFTEIKQQEGDIVQSAEIERAEITFSKETTDFIEENRTKWKETGDDSILLEVGKRLVKEIMTNTNDNIDLISKMQEKLDNEKDKN